MNMNGGENLDTIIVKYLILNSLIVSRHK